MTEYTDVFVLDEVEKVIIIKVNLKRPTYDHMF